MGIEALKAAVEAEGRERAAHIRREAEQEAARMRDEADAALDRRIARALRDHEPGLRRELGSRLAAARREARGRVLTERDAFLDRVFDAARRALPRDLEAPGTRAEFVARLERAIEKLPGAVVIRCPPGLAAIAQAAVAGRAGVRVEPDPELETGFRAISLEVGLEVDATLATLLELHRPRLAIDVLHRLVAAEGGPAA